MTTGLKQRKSFENVIDYIQNDKTKIKYPARTAKFLRNSFELSQLDNAGMMLMEQQQFREMKQREKEHLLRQLVANTSKSMTDARATQTEQSHQSETFTETCGPRKPPVLVKEIGLDRRKCFSASLARSACLAFLDCLTCLV